MYEPLYIIHQSRVRGLFFLALAGVSVLALWPGTASPPDLYGSDKIHHIAAFFTLAALMVLGWPPASVARAWRGFVILFIYGGAIELMQSLALIGRSASIYDLGADSIGIVAGMALGLVLMRWRA